ncbi:uncharacterized protein LOC129588412 [Paramacrobiotus metropolitanus]|uniref:uncharacterized protein LOC129588412 n=1 Tax=Paramacrobiotus metropolitanus TaxID=2943436 RepID=UPI002445C1C8|nr:uncharacterized protein LOC129588412 [Paramacrobiotus metropolitanus]
MLSAAVLASDQSQNLEPSGLHDVDNVFVKSITVKPDFRKPPPLVNCTTSPLFKSSLTSPSSSPPVTPFPLLTDLANYMRPPRLSLRNLSVCSSMHPYSEDGQPHVFTQPEVNISIDLMDDVFDDSAEQQQVVGCMASTRKGLGYAVTLCKWIVYSFGAT